MALALPDDFLSRCTQRVSGTHGAKQAAIIAAMQPVYQATLLAHSIDSDFRACYFTGQVVHESDQLCTMEEYASGAAYEGRHDLGNTEPGDGVRFKGRGPFQLTGRANYAKMGPRLGLDLIAHPEAAADPANGLVIACLFWNDHGLSALADVEDLEGITRRINGGLTGLASRQAATDKAFAALGYDAT